MEKKVDSIIRIALVGPESTGKTTITKELANYYNTTWVDEYAREYIGNLNRKYTKNDVEIIAQQQLIQEEIAAQKAKNLLFCDTNLLVTKIWCEYTLKEHSEIINKNYKPDTYRLHLLTDIDIEWQTDPQREHQNKADREQLFEAYKKVLENNHSPYAIIKGVGKARLENAIEKIEQLISL